MKTEMAIRPTHIESVCMKCGVCAHHCPVGIIEKGTGKFLDNDSSPCLGCLACVKACPNGGRVFRVDPIHKLMGKMVLSKAAKVRREPLWV